MEIHCKKRLSGLLALAVVAIAAGQAGAVITSGSNSNGTPPDLMVIPWDDTHFVIDEDLIFDPDAGPMTKHFEPPPTIIDATQPLPLPIWEDWFLVPGNPASGGQGSRPVLDWHEIILTPGWVWLEPGDQYGDDSTFDPTGSLITRNGDPWPHEHQPGENQFPPGTALFVEFDPITPGNVLDIHKALLWVGTEGNSRWGDGINDAGTQTIPEGVVIVVEYPTPEPTTLGLIGGGVLIMLRRRRRSGA